MNSNLAFNFNPYPDLGYGRGTQADRVYKALQRGEVNGRYFLQNYLSEYRTRISEVEKDLAPHGYYIRRRREKGSKFVWFRLERG